MVASIPGRVTIRDVAADSGLSISTVSRALTGARAVTPDIERRVQDSAAKLGYRANSIGRSLRTQRTNTVGLVVPDITNPFFPSLIQAIEHAARARGLSVLIADADNDPDVERTALQTLIDRRVDAMLISPTHVTQSRAALSSTARAVPTVQVDRVIDPALPFVRANQERPIAQLVAAMRATGRRHFAFVGQLDTIATSSERERAFATLMVNDYPHDVVRVHSSTTGRGVAGTILERWPETDAIVCANDLIAVGVLQDLGPSVGRRDVAVSGFDDTLIAEAMGLTSVRQPVDDLARAALATVFDGINAPHQVELESAVVVRASTT